MHGISEAADSQLHEEYVSNVKSLDMEEWTGY
jgi:hypothetical protein